MISKPNEKEGAGTYQMLGHVAGAFVAMVFAGLWVGLTLRSGVTYHLFPLAIAVLPALVAFRVFETSYRSWLLAPVGLAIVALTWGLLEAIQEAPTATFVHDQPGGVVAEVAVLALMGTGLGLWFSRSKS